MPQNPIQLLLNMAAQTKPYKKALTPPEQFSSPELENYGLQSALADEATTRFGQAQRAGASPNELAGLATFLGATRNNIAASPITAQQKESDLFRNAERSAMMEGYMPENRIEQNTSGAFSARGTNPLVQKRLAEEKMKTYAIDAPARNAVAQANAQGQWTMRRDLTNNAMQASQQADFIRGLQGMQGSPNAQVQSFTLPTKSGGGRVALDTTPATNISSGIATALSQARQNYTNALASGNEQQASAYKSGLDSLAASYVSNYPGAEDDTKAAVLNIYQHGLGGFGSIDEVLERLEPGFAQKHPVSYSQIKDMATQLGIK
jgi:hypothetical protein